MAPNTPPKRKPSRPSKRSQLPAAERTQGITCDGTTKQGKPCTRPADFGYLQCHFHREGRRECKGINADGSPCGRSPIVDTDNCYSHTPELVRAEQEAAKRCTATNRRGDPCTCRPMKGMNVCKTHGGSTRRARYAAAGRIAEDKARKEFARIGEVPPITNALEALQRRAGRIEAFCDFLEQQLQEIKVTDWRFPSEQGLEQIHGLVQLFGAQQDKSASSLAALARVQVDERLVAIEEKKADMIMAAYEAGIAAYAKAIGAAIDAAAQQAAYQAFSRRLTVVKGELETG